MAQYNYTQLAIPRKPAWTTSMTAEDIDRREKNVFLRWRSNIAAMEEANSSVRVTPFGI